jgi:hypothetical protein
MKMGRDIERDSHRLIALGTVIGSGLLFADLALLGQGNTVLGYICVGAIAIAGLASVTITAQPQGLWQRIRARMRLRMYYTLPEITLPLPQRRKMYPWQGIAGGSSWQPLFTVVVVLGLLVVDIASFGNQLLGYLGVVIIAVVGGRSLYLTTRRRGVAQSTRPSPPANYPTSE